MIREPLNKETPPGVGVSGPPRGGFGGGVSCDQSRRDSIDLSNRLDTHEHTFNLSPVATLSTCQIDSIENRLTNTHSIYRPSRLYRVVDSVTWSTSLCRWSCDDLVDRLSTYRQLQIGWHSILRLFLKTFNFVPGVPGFSLDFIYYLVLIVNPMGSILVCWKRFRNHLEMLCHPIGNWLYKDSSTCR